MSINEMIKKQLKTVVEQEISAVVKLHETIDDSWSQAVLMIRDCKGKVVVSGVGKSGNICQKIAASFTSTGMPSIFVHPTEASHGDLGLLDSRDVLIILSASGQTTELLDIVQYASRLKVPIIIVTKNPTSSLAHFADIILQIPNFPEACINGLAPTTSTTCQLVLGDALAITVMSLRGFTSDNFKELHPGGNLGALLVPVKNIMYVNDKMPLIDLSASIKEAIIEMNSKSLGCVGIVNHRNQYVGIFTDGDLRRSLQAEVSLEEPVSQYMTPSPLSISPEMMISELLMFFKNKGVPNVFVVKDKIPIGIVHVHQLASISNMNVPKIMQT
ncbi:KpsF/GutQ family sugar-phosphate isomerase [Limnoraphis robusta]|uniref:KpsF/GutQ family sugar-phosphate isomerase n=1 Tax=Limnoraphis robusta CCNP1315 TaxID=3110306 RepID=A0ABU5U6U0_9CYAN|nr:KpsF/GutQ family sugar-phosphate isomerase [Limnoraphis robusta]MEA5521833.1 KpsF/GutQ family sugar-phosphate isomerase [Limnoraphis robusta CCNP1315]MEA5543971.1 KpsF/GutQ family sugar-phosphate isomerase [Limnoraphis robusta CCNP1324]